MATQAPPVTITSTLQNIWNDDARKIITAALLASGNPIAVGLAGTLNSWWASWFLWPVVNTLMDALIAVGVIEIKVLILKFMSMEAKAKWAPVLSVLEQYNAEGKILSPEQQAAYDASLQEIVQNHPGLVRA